MFPTALVEGVQLTPCRPDRLRAERAGSMGHCERSFSVRLVSTPLGFLQATSNSAQKRPLSDILPLTIEWQIPVGILGEPLEAGRLITAWAVEVFRVKRVVIDLKETYKAADRSGFNISSTHNTCKIEKLPACTTGLGIWAQHCLIIQAWC